LRHIKKETRVCHLVLGLPMGGTEGLVDKMLRYPPEGFRSSAICLDEVGNIGESALRDGLDVSLIPRGQGFNWRTAYRLARHARAHAIDILHCHHYTPWCYGALSRLWYPRLRVIFTEHGRHYPDEPSFRHRLFNKTILPLTHAITAVSPFVASALERVEQIPLNRIQVVFNGIDGSRFADLPPKNELRRKLNLREDFLYFILCSRLDPIKWIEGLLAAYRKVLDVYPNSGLLLVGEGESRPQIEFEISRLGLSANVHLAGYQKNVPEWLVASDVFVLSSHSEGTSVSLIESMAAGLPSVVTNAGGNPFVVQDGITGMIVPVRDADAFASAMLFLARDSDLRSRYSSNARKRFEEQFQILRMQKAYAAIYQGL
jgi:glycosyltransferase involved in cell wall biosynthesis